MNLKPYLPRPVLRDRGRTVSLSYVDTMGNEGHVSASGYHVGPFIVHEGIHPATGKPLSQPVNKKVGRKPIWRIYHTSTGLLASNTLFMQKEVAADVAWGVIQASPPGAWDWDCDPADSTQLVKFGQQHVHPDYRICFNQMFGLVEAAVGKPGANFAIYMEQFILFSKLREDYGERVDE